MFSSILAGYLRRNYKVMLWLGLSFLLTYLVFFLYALPLEAVGYAALLSAAAGALFLVFDFLHYRANVRRLELLLQEQEVIPEELPQPFDLLETEYQNLAGRLYQDKTEAIGAYTRRYEDMLDYYTIWTHQIKTPISALRLLLQAAGGESRTAMEMELFKIEQYTDMALQYLRLGSTANDFVLQSYSLDDIVRQALRKYARLFIGRRISADFRETHLRVLTDEKWLVFVIEQLLSNALKYTDKGRISIYLKDGNTLVIEDTGIGISEQDLPRIFEKGYTGFNGRMDKKATGLGLYLCRQILDKLSHGIRAESKPGAGTRMMICFQEETLQ